MVANREADDQSSVKAKLPLRVVDAHHHIWDTRLGRHPWLCKDPPIRFRYGDYAAIRRPYLLEDYLGDATPIEITASIYVETEWWDNDPVGEMDWVAGLKTGGSLPSVAVAQAWLDRADVAQVLENHAGRGFVRSVRHKPRSNAAPGGAHGGMFDPSWRSGFSLLAPLDLRFDLQTPWWHLGEARALADAFPSTHIILNHAGLPADRSPEGIAGWRNAMRNFAGAPNVSVKISGIGQPGKPWSAIANREIVLTTIDLFGVDRCMFASNFPVDSLCGSFLDIFDGYSQIIANFSYQERDALFAQNAMRIYNIVDDYSLSAREIRELSL